MFAAHGTVVGTDPESLEERKCEMGLLHGIDFDVAFLLLDVLVVRAGSQRLAAEAPIAPTPDLRPPGGVS
jgi:hypothetical protein